MALTCSLIWWAAGVVVVMGGAAVAGQWLGWLLAKRRSQLRGPIPIPIFGNLLQFVSSSSFSSDGSDDLLLPHVALAKLSRHYGPLLHLQLGIVPTVVASSPAAARQILSTHDASLASRPPSQATSRLFYHSQMSAFMNPYGDPWRLTRKFYSLHMFNPRYVHDSHVPLLVHETLRLVFRDIYPASLSASPLDLSTLFYSLQRNVMYRAVLGKPPSSVLPSMTTPHFCSLLQEADRLLGSAQIATFLPALRILDYWNNRAMDRWHRTFDAFLDGAISQREQELKDLQASCTSTAAAESSDPTIDKEDGPKCILDRLLASDPPIDRERMKAMMLEVISGRSHTTALALDWAMAELLSNERVMKKAVEEVDRVVGKERMVSMEDVKERMPYIGAVVKETLRLHPTAPLQIPRMAMEPCQLKLQGMAHHILPNTLVVVNAWAIGRDTETWGSTASNFAPDRFLDDANLNHVDLRGQHFELLPFGSGRRICPGLAIAIPTLHLTIATLLHCFTWETPNHLPVDLSEKLGVTLPRRSPLLTIPTSFRLHPQLLRSHLHLLPI